jgi:hypothetical protein
MKNEDEANEPAESHYQVLIQYVELLVLPNLLCSNGFRPGVAVAGCVLISLKESVGIRFFHII